MWGSPSCPEAYVMIDCDRCDGAGDITMKEFMLELLTDVEACLDQYADADIHDDGRMIGNEAMEVMVKVQDAIKRWEEVKA